MKEEWTQTQTMELDVDVEQKQALIYGWTEVENKRQGQLEKSKQNPNLEN